MVSASVALLLASCATRSVSTLGPKAEPGKAVIKGGSVAIVPIGFQYTYIAGIDGVLTKDWSGSHQVRPGKHRFAFATSHASTVKSYAEAELNLKEGQQYVVEGSNTRESYADYVVLEGEARKEVLRLTGPLVAAAGPSAGGKIQTILKAKGWRE